MTAQLIAAQQRVVELTPLTEGVANLRSCVAEAHRDANKAEKVFKAMSVRSRNNDKEDARVWMEQDELL